MIPRQAPGSASDAKIARITSTTINSYQREPRLFFLFIITFSIMVAAVGVNRFPYTMPRCPLGVRVPVG